jgi:hypothetical protein
MKMTKLLLMASLIALSTLAQAQPGMQSLPLVQTQAADAPVATITSNTWSNDDPHVKGTLNRTIISPLMFIGYDADQHEVVRSKNYSIDYGTISASLSDPKKRIRFVRVIVDTQPVEPQQTVKAFSNIGWTYERSVQEYGQPTGGPWEGDDGKMTCDFELKEYTISLGYLHGKVGMVIYKHSTAPVQPVAHTAEQGQAAINEAFARVNAQLAALDLPVAPLSQSEIDFFLAENCPNAQWTAKTGNFKYWSGTVDGKEMYRVVSSDGALKIITVDWDEYISPGEMWFKLTH